MSFFNPNKVNRLSWSVNLCVHFFQAKQPFFILKISDISKFEEKLRECEQQLGISPKNGVPIEYHNIGMWSNLFVLIVIGLLALSFLKNKNFRFPGIADFVSHILKFFLVKPVLIKSLKNYFNYFLDEYTKGKIYIG